METGLGRVRILEIARRIPLPYEEGLRLQDTWVQARRSGEIPDRLLLVEHPPVITLGRSTDPAHLLLSPDELAARGITVHEVGRGGDVTYHGPGQLVGYPILDLKAGEDRPDRRDLHRYLRDLEEVLILALAHWKVVGWREPGRTGVWTSRGKIAAIGVRVSSGWITSHGFALNVSTPPDAFGPIVPCGIQDAAVASMAQFVDPVPPREAVESALIESFVEVFGGAPRWLDDQPREEPLPR
jgi:lipoyl(octanoyl) transferase